MPDTQNQNGYDESFWKNVDSLRSFLEEEEKNEAENNHSSQNTGSEPDDCQIHEEETEHEEVPAEEVPRKPQKKARPRGKTSSGLLIFLYLIIFLEIAAISAVGVSWYLWIH